MLASRCKSNAIDVTLVQRRPKRLELGDLENLRTPKNLIASRSVQLMPLWDFCCKDLVASNT